MKVQSGHRFPMVLLNGYDASHKHTLQREEEGICNIVIKLNGNSNMLTYLTFILRSRCNYIFI